MFLHLFLFRTAEHFNAAVDWFTLFFRRHHYEELTAGAYDGDEVDTVKYPKKRRMEDNHIEASSHHAGRRRSSAVA